jgi:phage shock protein PspC (stress-responsive transcriptional regulator)
MKKIININFQGRIIPIEETAYDILKQYIESLRGYFAKEEGCEEIINDIESRIAELFSDRLKRGAVCITDADVNAVIASIGRPEDLEEAEGGQEMPNSSAGSSAKAFAGNGSGTQQGGQQAYQAGSAGKRLFRSGNDKILGGVAAGLANYFSLDPSLLRIIFVIFTFVGGSGVLLYIILWIVLPVRNLVSNVRKRLYRNPDNRMIGGVSGGIAAYLNIDVWIPRIIFLAPFILGIITNMFRAAWMRFDPVPHFFLNGFGGTLFISYIVLWIILPEATTAAEKLEMRGEKVDLESITKTVKEDLETFKGRAERVGGEVKDRAQQFGQEMRQAGQNFATETAPFVRRSRTGIGHVIGVLFKVFFLFIAGIIVFSLVIALVAILSTGISTLPFKDFLLGGFWENFLAWSTLVLFLGIPVVALLTWLIRRIIGVKSKHHYLGYTFGSLWILGLISAIMLIASIARNFRSKASVREDMTLTQPVSNKLLVKVTEGRTKYYGSDWFGFDGEFPFFSKNEDSIMLNTVKVKIIRSNDSFYHVYAVKFSNGNNPALAENLAGNINFTISQRDSILYLPNGFTITERDKFRNQQVMVVAEIPVGKRVEIDRSIDQFNWFEINFNRRRGWNMGWDERWDNAYYYNSNREYIMTPEGLDEIDKPANAPRSRGRSRIEEETDINNNRPGNGEYRYRGNNNRRPATPERKDTIIISRDSSTTTRLSAAKTSSKTTAAEPGTAPEDGPSVFNLLTIFQ